MINQIKAKSPGDAATVPWLSLDPAVDPEVAAECGCRIYQAFHQDSPETPKIFVDLCGDHHRNLRFNARAHALREALAETTELMTNMAARLFADRIAKNQAVLKDLQDFESEVDRG